MSPHARGGIKRNPISSVRRVAPDLDVVVADVAGLPALAVAGRSPSRGSGPGIMAGSGPSAATSESTPICRIQFSSLLHVWWRLPATTPHGMRQSLLGTRYTICSKSILMFVLHKFPWRHRNMSIAFNRIAVTMRGISKLLEPVLAWMHERGLLFRAIATEVPRRDAGDRCACCIRMEELVVQQTDRVGGGRHE